MLELICILKEFRTSFVSCLDSICSASSDFCAGVYELVPYYKGENTVFDVSPSTVAVAVEHSHVTVPQKFQV